MSRLRLTASRVSICIVASSFLKLGSRFVFLVRQMCDTKIHLVLLKDIVSR